MIECIFPQTYARNFKRGAPIAQKAIGSKVFDNNASKTATNPKDELSKFEENKSNSRMQVTKRQKNHVTNLITISIITRGQYDQFIRIKCNSNSKKIKKDS